MLTYPQQQIDPACKGDEKNHKSNITLLLYLSSQSHRSYLGNNVNEYNVTAYLEYKT